MINFTMTPKCNSEMSYDFILTLDKPLGTLALDVFFMRSIELVLSYDNEGVCSIPTMQPNSPVVPVVVTMRHALSPGTWSQLGDEISKLAREFFAESARLGLS